MKFHTKALAAAGVTAAILFGGGLPAGADPTSLTATPNPVRAGENLAVAAEGCGIGDIDGVPVYDEGARVLIDIATEDGDEAVAVATTDPDEDGSWSTSIAIPADTSAGDDYVVHARCVLDYEGYSGYTGIPVGAPAARASRAAPVNFDYEPVILEILPARSTTGGGGEGGGSTTGSGTSGSGSGSGGSLPRTGTSIAWLLAIGSGLVATGCAAEVVNRRRGNAET